MLVDGPAAARARRGGPLSNRLERAMHRLRINATLIFPLCLRIVSPPAWGDMCKLFVRVLGARRLLPALRNNPQQM
jgi:hypothetical protein